MSHRYRLYPTAGQAEVMAKHCSHARFVWNLALEQAHLARQFGRHADHGSWTRQLTEARATEPWLAAGSVTVQQQALRDLRQAFRNWWSNPGHFRHPTWRKAGVHEGFRLVGRLAIAKASRRWAVVVVPKAGRVKFRLSRPVPPETKSARVTCDRAGRWHVSFTASPPAVEGPGTGVVVGIDRGVEIDYQCSDGRRWDAPGLRPAEAARLRRLQRRLASQVKGSNRRACTKRAIARLRAREADRRRDAVEKATTELARTADVVRIEDLRVKQMIRSAKGTAVTPGRNVQAKAGLNRSIAESGWSMFARRLGDKIGDRLELVPAAFTSQRCSCCGHTAPENRESQAVFRCRACGYSDNADVNAAKNVAARHAVTGRGGTGAIRPPNEASTTLTDGHRVA